MNRKYIPGRSVIFVLVLTVFFLMFGLISISGVAIGDFFKWIFKKAEREMP